MLLTKANVKGHIWTNSAGGFGFDFCRGPGLLSPPNWVTEAKGVDGLSEQWSEGRNFTVCNRVPCHLTRKKRKKKHKMFMYEWSCDGLNSSSVALKSTINRSRMSVVLFLRIMKYGT